MDDDKRPWDFEEADSFEKRMEMKLNKVEMSLGKVSLRPLGVQREEILSDMERIRERQAMAFAQHIEVESKYPILKQQADSNSRTDTEASFRHIADTMRRKEKASEDVLRFLASVDLDLSMVMQKIENANKAVRNEREQLINPGETSENRTSDEAASDDDVQASLALRRYHSALSPRRERTVRSPRDNLADDP